MGDATVAEVKAEFGKRVQAGEFIETSNRAPGRAFTTSEMIEHERNTIQMMRQVPSGDVTECEGLLHQMIYRP